MRMKKILPLFIFLCVTSTAHAYNPIVVQPKEQYGVILVEDDPYIEHHFLGTLEDYPEMFEFTTDVSFDLSVRVLQRDSGKAVPFGLIMVRQNEDDGGVSEVARLNQPVGEWSRISDSVLGLDLLESTRIEKSVSPGTYRIEVSTPDNKGKYMLVMGDESKRAGFFKTIGHIYTIQRHLGYTPFHLIFSRYIYPPLGILVILYGAYRVWRYRKEVTHVS
jgi:hypothetical protein